MYATVSISENETRNLSLNPLPPQQLCSQSLTDWLITFGIGTNEVHSVQFSGCIELKCNNSWCIQDESSRDGSLLFLPDVIPHGTFTRRGCHRPFQSLVTGISTQQLDCAGLLRPGSWSRLCARPFSPAERARHPAVAAVLVFSLCSCRRGYRSVLPLSSGIGPRAAGLASQRLRLTLLSPPMSRLLEPAVVVTIVPL